MRIGFSVCRDCGGDAPSEKMISGLCPSCARLRVEALAGLQREYQAAVDAGDPGAAAEVAAVISAYEQRERVRLKAARRPLAGVRNAGL